MSYVEVPPLLGLDFSSAPIVLEALPAVGKEHVLIGDGSFGRNGCLEARSGDLLFSLSHSPAESNSTSEAFFDYLGSDRGLFKNITQFSLSAKSGQMLDLVDLPDGWTSYFSIDPGKTNKVSVASSTYKSTVLRELPLLTPAGILVHLHEVGHAHTTDFEMGNTSRIALDEKKRPLTTEEKDIILIQEANAWSFAFNKLRAFLSTDPSATFYMGDLLRFAYESCLVSYELEIENLNRKEQMEGFVKGPPRFSAASTLIVRVE